jgi:hypothetical protein
MKRPEVIWALAFVALLAVAYGLLPAPRASDRADSFTEDGGGKLAFYRLASRLLARVERSAGSLIPEDGDADTLVLLGPARYPDRAQWQTLHDWVHAGHALVFAARWRDPAVSLPPFGIEVAPLASVFSDEETETETETEMEMESETDSASSSSSSEDATEDEEQDTALDSLFSFPIETELVDGVPRWRSLGEVRFTSEDASVLLWRNDRPQVVWQPVGDGAIVVVASDYVFSNASVARDDNGALAFRILELAAPTGTVYFDEQMNAAGAPKVVGILFEEPFRKLTMELLLVAVLLGWMASVRFGPEVSGNAPPRRSLVEHAEALGSLHFRVGSGGRLLAAYLEYFRREFATRKQQRSRDAALGSPSNASSMTEHAARAAKSPNLEPARVGELVRALARERQRSG